MGRCQLFEIGTISISIIGKYGHTNITLMYDLAPALNRSCCRSSKQDGSVSAGTWNVGATRKTRSE